jgi:hypothetical protein
VRLATAIGVIPVTLAAAAYIHDRRAVLTSNKTATPALCLDQNGLIVSTQLGGYAQDAASCAPDVDSWHNGNPTGTVIVRGEPSWDTPVAILLDVGGVAVAAGIPTTGHHAKPS